MLNNGVPLQGDEPQPEPVKVPTLAEIAAYDPFEYASTHGLWGTD
jgi:hypothetical protein